MPSTVHVLTMSIFTNGTVHRAITNRHIYTVAANVS